MRPRVPLRERFGAEFRQEQASEQSTGAPREPLVHADDGPVVLLDLLLARGQPSDEGLCEMGLDRHSGEPAGSSRQTIAPHPRVTARVTVIPASTDRRETVWVATMARRPPVSGSQKQSAEPDIDRHPSRFRH